MLSFAQIVTNHWSDTNVNLSTLSRKIETDKSCHCFITLDKTHIIVLKGLFRPFPFFLFQEEMSKGYTSWKIKTAEAPEGLLLGMNLSLSS